MAKLTEKLDSIKMNVNEVIVDLDEAIDIMLVSMLSGGHILIEGPPGLGKTTLAKTFAQAVGGTFSRIQMTPDLLPSDILGLNIYNPYDSTWVLRKGPIFGNIVLIDELNRASPKVQSAFLQVMQEHEVSIENETLSVPQPFMVLGTQLPLGELGTYPLTSVQIDRFSYHLNLNNPSVESEVGILERVDDIESIQVSEAVSTEEVTGLMEEAKKVHIEPILLNYIVNIVQDLRQNRYVRLGPSPRASIWLYKGSRAKAVIENREYVIPDDIKYLVPYVVSHRVELTQEARYENVSVANMIEETLGRVSVPKSLD